MDLDQLANSFNPNGYAENISYDDSPSGTFTIKVVTYRADSCTGAPYVVILTLDGSSQTFTGNAGIDGHEDIIHTFNYLSLSDRDAGPVFTGPKVDKLTVKPYDDGVINTYLNPN